MRSTVRKKIIDSQLLLGFARDKDIKALFELLGMLSKVDGKVAAEQIAEIERFMTGQVPATRRDFAITCFRQGKEVQLVKDSVTSRAFVLYGFQDHEGTERWLEPLQILDILFRVALADGELSFHEDFLIDCARATLGVHKRSFWTLRDTIAERLGIQISRDTESFAERPEAASQSTNKKTSDRKPIKHKMPSKQEALTIFELEADATVQEIKIAYRALVKRFHPDHLSGKTSEDALKEAVKRFCEVQEAYEVLTRAEN